MVWRHELYVSRVSERGSECIADFVSERFSICGFLYFWNYFLFVFFKLQMSTFPVYTGVKEFLLGQ